MPDFFYALILLILIAVSIHLLMVGGRFNEINVIWYAFSLVLVIRFAVDVAAYANGYQSLHVFLELELGIPRKYTLGLHEMLTNARDELLLVAAIVVVAIVPQLLTYVLAGFAGCTKSPPLIWYFERLAAWILIKFLAALGGIVLEETISPTTRSFSSVQAINLSLFSLSLSFFLAFVQTSIIDMADGRIRPPNWVGRIHRWLTRNLPSQ